MVSAGRIAAAPSVHRLVEGARFSRKYVLLRKVAVGGMGEIWIARNDMTQAEVALKVLRKDLPQQQEAEARFRHEASVGAMLSHRHIVRVFDLVVDTDGTLALVMELLRGESLETLLERHGPLDAATAVAIMTPLLSALHHAHEMGLVHRDVKPPNVFLAVDPDGHVIPKLLDFGIAKLPGVGVQTLPGSVLGTPQYMSPEQIRNETAIDGRSDLFGAGSVLFEMLTGKPPFSGSTVMAALASVLEDPVDPDPRIDPKLWLVLRRALAKQPYERFLSANDLGAALQKAVDRDDGALVQVLKHLPLAAEPMRPPAFSASVLEPLAVAVPSHSPQEATVVIDGRRARHRAIVAASVLATLLAVGLLVRSSHSRVDADIARSPMTTAPASAPSTTPSPALQPPVRDTPAAVQETPTSLPVSRPPSRGQGERAPSSAKPKKKTLASAPDF